MQVGSIADSVPCALVSCVCFGVFIVVLLLYLVAKMRKTEISDEKNQSVDLTPDNKVFDGTYTQIPSAENKTNEKTIDKYEDKNKNQDEKTLKENKSSKQPAPRHQRERK